MITALEKRIVAVEKAIKEEFAHWRIGGDAPISENVDEPLDPEC